MAYVEPTLTGLITADAPLTALIGSNPSRIFPDTIGNAIRPAMAMQRISNPRTQSLKGDSGLGRARIQITIFARSANERAALIAMLRDVLVGYKDRFDGGVIDNVSYDDARNQYDPITKDYLAFVDFIVWHIEP